MNFSRNRLVTALMNIFSSKGILGKLPNIITVIGSNGPLLSVLMFGGTLRIFCPGKIGECPTMMIGYKGSVNPYFTNKKVLLQYHFHFFCSQ